MKIMKIACLLLLMALATAMLSSTMSVFAAVSKPISTDEVSLCAQKLDLIHRASSLAGLPWPAGMLVYECRRDKTFFFIVQENDQELIDLLGGAAWAVRVQEEECNPFVYEGGMVKVLKPKFTGLNLSGFS
jgi:hypothetical protein